jgi:predicted transposase YbfD/YdcC
MVMDDRAQGDLMRSLHELPDPRAANVRYRLVDIVGISLLAIICDAQGWEDFHDFAKAKYAWLSTFMDLEHGVPSADTFRRVLSRLDPEAFEAAFIKWSQAMADGSQGRLVAIDGKSIRRSFERSWDKAGMTHMVSAFACVNGQVLAQVKAQNPGNEPAAIAALLGMIDLQGALISIDAIGTRKDLAEQIHEAGGDYVLCVKSNQRTLHKALKAELDDVIRGNLGSLRVDHHRELDAGHGRIETRQVWASDDLSWLKQARDWPGLRSVAVVQATRDVAGQGTQTQRRYYISSLPADAAALAAAIRGHWSIENRLHHVLDVSFHEDQSRVRRDHGPENLSRLTRLALNLLRIHGDRHTKRKSIRGRRKIASWDHDFLLALLTG